VKIRKVEIKKGLRKDMKSVFDICDFGAQAGGKTKNTKAIQDAIDECHRAGGGMVLCGAGTFLTGALLLKSNVELHLAAGCRLAGSGDLADYPDFAAQGFRGEYAPEKSVKYLVGAAGAENISITGPGELNGSGPAFYEPDLTAAKLPKPPTPRPRIIMFFQCRKVLFEGASFADSPCWTFWLMQCREVNVHRVRISGNRRLRNVDGIDVDSCRNVTISDCIMDTEDDCVVLRAIQSMYASPAVCENITVSNCVLESACQGIRIGCPGDAVIRNCSFSNLVINSAANGITIQHPKRYLPKGSRGLADIHDIVFSNIAINCRSKPIWIFVEEEIALQRLSDLSFANLRIKSGDPCLVQGSRETTIRNISFSNIEIETSGDDAIILRNCENVRLDNTGLTNRREQPAGAGQAAV